MKLKCRCFFLVSFSFIDRGSHSMFFVSKGGHATCSSSWNLHATTLRSSTLSVLSLLFCSSCECHDLFLFFVSRWRETGISLFFYIIAEHALYHKPTQSGNVQHARSSTSCPSQSHPSAIPLVLPVVHTWSSKALDVRSRGPRSVWRICCRLACTTWLMRTSLKKIYM